MKKNNNMIGKFIKNNKNFLIKGFITITLIFLLIYRIGLIPALVLSFLILGGIKLYPIIKNKANSKKRRKKLFNVILMVGLISGIILIVFLFLFMTYIVLNAPSFNPENLYKKEATLIYDSNNDVIARLGTEKREKIKYADLPQVLINAIVATEDSRYYQHNGFDLPRFMKASFGQLSGNSDAGGASTISMQVVKNNYTSIKQSVTRKFTDIYLAIFKLEKKYTKEEILEFYVNAPYLGSSSYGVEQACKTYFGKSVKDINLAEASLIAGMFQAPGAYDPYLHPDRAAERRKTVLYLMRKHGYISAEEEKIASSVSIKSLLYKDTAESALEFQGYIDTVVEEIIASTGNNPYNVPMKIYTNMNKEKQQYINRVMSGELFKFPNEVIQTGITVTDVNTGAILAVGANRNLNGERSYNFATMIKRQPGSTAKPIFDYGPGMEYNNWSTYTPFLDEPYQYSGGTKVNNWDGTYMGLMTLRTALYESRNIPAIKAFQKVSNKNILSFVQSLGITPEIDNGRIHEAHAIGAFNGTNPAELAGAYGSFVNGGYFVKPHSVNKIEYRESGKELEFNYDKKRVMSDSTAFMITDVLVSGVDYGSNRVMKIPNVKVGVKSGTTNFDEATKKAHKLPDVATNDSWVVGYSPDYVISFWYGYEKISNKYYNTTASAGNQRTQLFKVLGNGIFEKNNKQFAIPDSVVKVQVEKGTSPAMLPSAYTPADMILSEYFKKGTEPTDVSPRFDKIKTNVINLDGNYSNDKFNLSWNAVSKPEYLTDTYFKNNYKDLYGDSINTYLIKNNDFNSSYMGNFGYNIYSKNRITNELTFLGFTSDNNFTYPTPSKNITFVVKTGFDKLKSNQSDGSEITISNNGSDIIDMSLNGSTTIKLTIGSTYSEPNPSVIVLENMTDVTNKATITKKITKLSSNTVVTTIDTSIIENYTIEYNVSYGGTTEKLLRTINVQ
jgi:penicillin-binding protein 1A